MLWLGQERGFLTDWITQLWVRFSGRRVEFTQYPWLFGPIGNTSRIGSKAFDDLAQREGLTIVREGDRGLVGNFADLAAPDFSPDQVHPTVAHFYTNTSEYELDAWAEWKGLFRPFGRLLARIFSRRLQQLNVPISGLDTSRGLTSEVLQLIDPTTGKLRYTAWVRELVSTGNVLYAGAYSLAEIPGRQGCCVKVVFPLPNGNAIVLMRPKAHSDGSLSVISAGKRFGDPGFYFAIRGRNGSAWARYVASLKEVIRIYPADESGLRADHVLTLWGVEFLRLHYRMRRPMLSATAAAT